MTNVDLSPDQEITDYIALHERMWQILNDGVPNATVVLASVPMAVSVTRVDEPHKLFCRANYLDMVVLTQNMRKPSVNTANCANGWKMTWFLRKGSYVGKVETSPIGTTMVVQLPELVVLRCVEKDQP